jgi:hypothetical protein
LSRCCDLHGTALIGDDSQFYVLLLVQSAQIKQGRISGATAETLVSHRDQLELVAAELLKSETIDGPTFYRLVRQERPSVKDPGQLAAAAGAAQSEEKPKLVDQTM